MTWMTRMTSLRHIRHIPIFPKSGHGHWDDWDWLGLIGIWWMILRPKTKPEPKGSRIIQVTGVILRIPFLLCLGLRLVVRLLFHLLLQASHARAVRPKDRVLVGQRVKARKVQAVLLDLGIRQQQTWRTVSKPSCWEDHGHQWRVCSWKVIELTGCEWRLIMIFHCHPLSHVILTGMTGKIIGTETGEYMMRVWCAVQRWGGEIDGCVTDIVYAPMLPPIFRRRFPKVQVKTPSSPPLNQQLHLRLSSSTLRDSLFKAGHLKKSAKAHLNIRFDPPKSTYNNCWVYTPRLGLL